MRYSLNRAGYDFQIRPDFKLGEFASPDSPVVLIRDSILDVVQRLRDHAGAPVIVNSGYRTEAHNAAVGGVENSAHLTGHAVDVDVVGETPEAVALWAERQADVYGVGRYNSFTHIDTKAGEQRRWDERTEVVAAQRESSTLLDNSPAPTGADARGVGLASRLISRFRGLRPADLVGVGAGAGLGVLVARSR